MAGVTYEYDRLHRLKQVTYDDGTAIVFDYDAAGNRTLRVMNSDPNTVYLSTHVTSAGWGTVSRDPQAIWYTIGSQVVLTAGVSPARFGGWLGDVPEGHENDNPLTLTMDAYKSVTLRVLYAPGDLDTDGDIDSIDFEKFATCMGGPGVTTPPPGADPTEFDNADTDRDGDADLRDFAELQQHFGEGS